MDKLTQAIIENGLPQIREELVELENTLNIFPEKLAEQIDPIIQENINKIVASASNTQEYVKELQAENKSIIKKELNNAQTDFISTAKDSLERLIKPHSDKLAEIPSSIDNLSSELECISKKIEAIGKPKSNSFVIIIVMILSLIVGGIGGVFFADNYNSKALKTKDLEYSVLATSIDATLAELPKAQKNKVFGILKKHITAETSKQSK